MNRNLLSSFKSVSSSYKIREFLKFTVVSKSSFSSSLSSEPLIDFLYDGKCSICAIEVTYMKKRDIENKVRFTDISLVDYDPTKHGNVSFEEGMKKIKAVLPGNKVITGVEVFRLTYKAIGLGWIFEITRIPVIGKIADRLYDVFAEYRLWMTGRESLAVIIKNRSTELAELQRRSNGCDGNQCDLPWTGTTKGG